MPPGTVRRLIEAGHEILDHPIELLPQARETVEALARDRRLILITKGDLLDQERKLAQSGLGDLFDGVEVVSDKTATTYAAILTRHGSVSERALMVGYSLRSDVIPMIEAGGWGVHVPHELTWTREHADAPEDHTRFRPIETLGELLPLIRGLSAHDVVWSCGIARHILCVADEEHPASP